MPTYTIYADTTDAYIQARDSSYATARAGGGTLTIVDNTQGRVGQQFFSPNHFVFQYIVGFGTGIVGSDSVDNVTLTVTRNGTLGGDAIDIEAFATDPGGSVDTDDFVPGATLGGLTRLAYVNTAGWGNAATRDFTSEASFAGVVNKAGTTWLLLAGERQRLDNAPSGSEYVILFSADQSGTTQDPKLVVVTSAGGGDPIVHKGAGAGIGVGTGAAVPTVTRRGAIAATGKGIASAAGTVIKPATATGQGVGTATAFARMTKPGVAIGTAFGTATATATVIKPGAASGQGVGTGTAAASMTYRGVIAASGNGTATARGTLDGVNHRARAAGIGAGAGAARGLATWAGRIAASGAGAASAAPTRILPGRAVGQGFGTAAALAGVTRAGRAAGFGTGIATAAATLVKPGRGTGLGVGTGAAAGTASYRGRIVGAGRGRATATYEGAPIAREKASYLPAFPPEGVPTWAPPERPVYDGGR